MYDDDWMDERTSIERDLDAIYNAFGYDFNPDYEDDYYDSDIDDNIFDEFDEED